MSLKFFLGRGEAIWRAFKHGEQVQTQLLVRSSREGDGLLSLLKQARARRVRVRVQGNY